MSEHKRTCQLGFLPCASSSASRKLLTSSCWQLIVTLPGCQTAKRKVLCSEELQYETSQSFNCKYPIYVPRNFWTVRQLALQKALLHKKWKKKRQNQHTPKYYKVNETITRFSTAYIFFLIALQLNGPTFKLLSLKHCFLC